MEDIHTYLAILFTGYFLGSIPFGLILSKAFGYGDIRKIGSGNIGATNVLRTGNKKLALSALLLDSTKGLIVVAIVSTYLFGSFIPNAHQVITSGHPSFLLVNIFGFYPFIAGLFAVLGHCFPIWLKFKGGKGVATAFGVLLAAVPYAGLAACAVWIITAKITKISSLSALVAVGIAPIVTLFIYGATPAGICALITLLVWIRHKDNIKRLLKGEEPKTGSAKKNKEEAQVESVSK